MSSLTKVNTNNMNEPNSTSKNQVENLVTLQKYAKFWAIWSHRFVPWAFFVVNNGNLPNYDEAQQWRGNIFFTH